MSLYYEVLEPTQPALGTVLLSSGLGGSANYWKLQTPALLQAGWRVLAYDQRGTGRSPAALPTDYRIAHMVDDVREVMQASGTAQCHIVGHALGGLVGLQLALQAPECVQSLTLINAWAVPNAHSARCFDARLALLDHVGPAAYVAAQPLFLYPAAWALVHAQEVDAEVAHALAHFPGAANMHARIAALRAFDVQAQLSQLNCPVLLSAAMDDLLVPYTQSCTMVPQLRQVQTHYQPYGGHAHNITEAKAFNEKLLGFLHLSKPLAAAAATA